MKNSKIKLFSGLISMGLMMCLLILSSAFLFNSDTLAWFAQNDTADAGNMQVRVDNFDITIKYFRKGPQDAEYTEITSFDSIFEGLLPGEVVSLKVEYTSNESSDCEARLSFDYRSGCEEPIVIEDEYYYFGTQLKLVERDEFLVSPPTNLVSYDSEQTIEDRMIGSLTVAAGTTSSIEFSVLFVNYADVDQNAYQGFGTDKVGGTCYRIITSDFD